MILTLKSVSMYTYYVCIWCLYTIVYIKVSAVASFAAFERDALVMIITAMEQSSNGNKRQKNGKYRRLCAVACVSFSSMYVTRVYVFCSRQMNTPTSVFSPSHKYLCVILSYAQTYIYLPIQNHVVCT